MSGEADLKRSPQSSAFRKRIKDKGEEKDKHGDTETKTKEDQ
jgi:hypothetical protein